MSTSYRLVLKSGAEAGQIFPVTGEQVTIGREHSNDIVISDPEISRRHAHIYLQGVNYVLEDLGSTNGTSVNGQRLVGPYILRPGELITLGENTHLLFEAVIDPDATMAAGKGEPQPSYPGVQRPPIEERIPSYPPPVPPQTSSGYAGQVPVSPPHAGTAPKRKLSTLVIILIILVVLFVCTCVGFVIFDALNLYCEFPGIMNLVIPGACPP